MRDETIPAISTDTLDQLIAYTNSHTRRPGSEISLAATFESLGCDSLDVIEITMAMEEYFGIHIDDEHTCETSHTVEEFARMVDEARRR